MEGEGGEGEIEEYGVGVLGVLLERGERGVGRVGEGLFPGGDQSLQPGAGEGWPVADGVREEKGDGVRGGLQRQRGLHFVTPELEAEGADLGRGDRVGE